MDFISSDDDFQSPESDGKQMIMIKESSKEQLRTPSVMHILSPQVASLSPLSKNQKGGQSQLALEGFKLPRINQKNQTTKQKKNQVLSYTHIPPLALLPQSANTDLSIDLSPICPPSNFVQPNQLYTRKFPVTQRGNCNKIYVSDKNGPTNYQINRDQSRNSIKQQLLKQVKLHLQQLDEDIELPLQIGGSSARLNPSEMSFMGPRQHQNSTSIEKDAKLQIKKQKQVEKKLSRNIIPAAQSFTHLLQKKDFVLDGLLKPTKNKNSSPSEEMVINSFQIVLSQNKSKKTLETTNKCSEQNLSPGPESYSDNETPDNLSPVKTEQSNQLETMKKVISGGHHKIRGYMPAMTPKMRYSGISAQEIITANRHSCDNSIGDDSSLMNESVNHNIAITSPSEMCNSLNMRIPLRKQSSEKSLSSISAHQLQSSLQETNYDFKVPNSIEIERPESSGYDELPAPMISVSVISKRAFEGAQETKREGQHTQKFKGNVLYDKALLSQNEFPKTIEDQQEEDIATPASIGQRSIDIEDLSETYGQNNQDVFIKSFGGTSHQLLCDELGKVHKSMSITTWHNNNHKVQKLKKQPRWDKQQKKLQSRSNAQLSSWNPVGIQYPIQTYNVLPNVKMDPSIINEENLDIFQETNHKSFESLNAKQHLFQQSDSKSSITVNMASPGRNTVQSDQSIISNVQNQQSTSHVQMPPNSSMDCSTFKYGTSAARKTTLRQVRKLFGPNNGPPKRLRQNETTQLMLSGKSPKPVSIRVPMNQDLGKCKQYATDKTTFESSTFVPQTADCMKSQHSLLSSLISRTSPQGPYKQMKVSPYKQRQLKPRNGAPIMGERIQGIITPLNLPIAENQQEHDSSNMSSREKQYYENMTIKEKNNYDEEYGALRVLVINKTQERQALDDIYSPISPNRYLKPVPNKVMKNQKIMFITSKKQRLKQNSSLLLK